MINYLTEKFNEAKLFIQADKLNALEFIASVTLTVGALSTAWAYNSSNFGFIIGAIIVAVGIVLEVSVYIIEEVRMASPIWHDVYDDMIKDIEEEETKQAKRDLFNNPKKKKDGEDEHTN